MLIMKKITLSKKIKEKAANGGIGPAKLAVLERMARESILDHSLIMTTDLLDKEVSGLISILIKGNCLAREYGSLDIGSSKEASDLFFKYFS
jgi:hypothetical protein